MTPIDTTNKNNVTRTQQISTLDGFIYEFQLNNKLRDLVPLFSDDLKGESRLVIWRVDTESTHHPISCPQQWSRPSEKNVWNLTYFVIVITKPAKQPIQISIDQKYLYILISRFVIFHRTIQQTGLLTWVLQHFHLANKNVYFWRISCLLWAGIFWLKIDHV